MTSYKILQPLIVSILIVWWLITGIYLRVVTPSNGVGDLGEYVGLYSLFPPVSSLKPLQDK